MKPQPSTNDPRVVRRGRHSNARGCSRLVLVVQIDRVKSRLEVEVVLHM
jgi:hypothetical protein